MFLVQLNVPTWRTVVTPGFLFNAWWRVAEEVEAEIELSENTSVCPAEIRMPCAHTLLSLSHLHTALTRSTEFLSLSLSAFLLVFPPTYPQHPPFSYLSFTHAVILSRHTCALSVSLSLSLGTHSFAVTHTLSCTYILFLYSTNMLFLSFCLPRKRWA